MLSLKLSLLESLIHGLNYMRSWNDEVVIQILLSLSRFSIFCLMNRCQVWDGKQKAVSIKDFYPFFSAHFKSMLLFSDCEQSLICSKHKSAIECDNALARSQIFEWDRDCNQSKRTLTLLLLCILHPVCPGGYSLIWPIQGYADEQGVAFQWPLCLKYDIQFRVSLS